MTAKNKTILILFFMFSGVTPYLSQGWAFQRSVNAPLQAEYPATAPLVANERLFTCTKQGPGANKKVVVQVSYKKSNGSVVPLNVSAKDLTDPNNSLEALLVGEPYIYLKEINPKNPKDPKTLVSKSVNTGPSQGSIICTNNNYPVFVWGNHAWFIKNAKRNQ